LINSTYSAAELGNSVTATFRECAYEVGFGSAASPNTKVAVVQERGTWTFAKEDFRDRDPRKAILKGPQADVILIIEPGKRP
jgi:hypothetical protein